MVVIILLMMVVPVFVRMLLVRMGVTVMMMRVLMFMPVVVIMSEMDIEFCAFDIQPLLAADVQVITLEFEFGQLALELRKIDPEIEQSADEHVAANPAENVQVDRVHPFRLRITYKLILVHQPPAH